jgi:hypothetical protein
LLYVKTVLDKKLFDYPHGLNGNPRPEKGPKEGLRGEIIDWGE